MKINKYQFDSPFFLSFIIGCVLGFISIDVKAEGSKESNQFTLPEIQVRSLPKLFYFEPVVDKKIVAGRKVTTIEKKELPPIAQNNFRQMLAEIPGLMVSEVNNESWASLTYRGMGDPHESFNILSLRNGVPSTPDPFGYPAAYYVPPFEALEKIEFVRGGAGLLYGPQPGGALNYILREAPKATQAAKFRTTNLGGSFGRYNSYTEFSQGGERWGALVSFNSRGQEGFREANNFSNINNPRVNLRYTLDDSSKILLDIDMYQGRFGEPGGLAKTPGTNVLTLNSPRSVTLRNDQIELDRNSIVMGWDKEWSENTSSLVEVWNSYFRRESFRQTLGGSPAFGGIARGNSNVIQDQRFFTNGVQARVQHDYWLGEHKQVFTAHVQATDTQSPFTQEAGSSPTARQGTSTRDISRETQSQALVIENAFQAENWIVTPGVRVENIDQRIDESLNSLSSIPLRQDTNRASIALLGLGAEYKLNQGNRVYGNYSEGYKPPAFQDTVPLGVTDTISEDLREARTQNYELGIRGSFDTFDYDVSLFRIDFSNIFGRIGANFQNVGEARSEGLDVLVSHSFSPSWRGFFSGSFLDARFIAGPVNGNRTQYSPDQTLRAGLSYLYENQSFARLQVQSLSSHFADDGNSANWHLGPSTLVDLAGQHYLTNFNRNQIYLNWGISNLTDQSVPARVRSNGIEPAQPRAYFAGFTLNY